jgi:hypothetical protein
MPGAGSWKRWARRRSLVAVAVPGGYQPFVDGAQARATDGVHITQAAVDNIIEPALNQIIANVAGAVDAGNS